MKNTKRRFEVYSFLDCAGIASHLSKMAQRGWLIEKISNFGWTYRRIEPKELTFFVSYYPKASEFDPEPTEEQKMFHDFCKHTGWELAVTSAQMQIFYNEQENPVPIETDPVLEVETIRQAAKKSYLPNYFVLLAVSILNGSLFISRLLGDPIGVLSSASSLFSGFVWIILFLLCMVELCGYVIWYSKAKKAAELGEFLETPGFSQLQRFMLAVVLAGLVYWLITVVIFGSAMLRVVGLSMMLYVAALIFLVNALKQLLKNKKVSKDVNRFVTLLSCFVLSFAMMGIIIFGVLRASQSGLFGQKRETYEYHGNTYTIYVDEVPLTVEDLLGTKYDGYNRSQISEESLLLGQFEVSLYPRLDAEHFMEMPGLRYTITKVRLPVLYDICKDYLLQKYDESNNTDIPDGLKQVYVEQDASSWAAKEVYRLTAQDTGAKNYYLLCYKDCIVEIIFDWEPTIEQMAIVGEKLAGE